MRIAIIGLGHLGSVTAGCLTTFGHHILGIDRKRSVASAFAGGRAPIDEPGLAPILRSARRAGLIEATDRVSPGVFASDLIMICVETPRTAARTLAFDNIVQICEQLQVNGDKSRPLPPLVIRSTLPPGAFDLALARFYPPRGRLRMVYNPAFSREGNAVEDTLHPGRIILGVKHPRDALKIRRLYKSFDAPIFATAWSNAEILKCAENSFHALKVTFANEIGAICDSFHADAEEVMRILCADRRLNISAAYLRPGLPFGGPCLDKDLDALIGSAKAQSVDAPLLQAILESNRRHFRRIVSQAKQKKSRVGFLGLSHKAGVTDHRNSHLVTLARQMRAAGLEVDILRPAGKTAGSRNSRNHSPDGTGRFDLIFTPQS